MRPSSDSRRRRALATAAVAAFAAAGGIAYAAIPSADGTYHGCVHHARGALRVIDPATERCNANNETAITFATQGAAGPAGPTGPTGAPGATGRDGDDGISPSVAQLAPGNAHCPAGGAAITDAAGTTAYVCSGADGAEGADGADGADGDDFAGTFTSANGVYTLAVTDGGISVAGPGSQRIRLDGGGITIESDGHIELRGDSVDVRSAMDLDVLAGTSLLLRGGVSATLDGGAAATVRSVGSTVVTGSQVRLGGATCLPAARVSDVVVGTASPSGSLTAQIGSGSPIVCIG